MNVHEVMTPAPSACSPTESLTRAAQIMWERDCGAVPVTDATGTVVGIVTDRDLCMAAYTRGRALHEIHVDSVMSKVVFTVRSDASASEALDLMNAKAVRRLPVVDGKSRLVGMLSLADCVRATKSGAAKKRLSESSVLETVASVSAARPVEPTAPLPKSSGSELATKSLFPAASPKASENAKAATAKSGKKR